MPLLRITQTTTGQDQYRIRVEVSGVEGLADQAVEAPLHFRLSPQDHEDLRWYLEDYLQHPYDPAPVIAARVEQRLAEIGRQLFEAIFDANRDAQDLWAILRRHLDDTRVEIRTGVREATTVPWELLHDPKTDTHLALHAHAFVRTFSRPARAVEIPRAEAGPIRILLVICRPRLGEDVPFRSVATRLLKSLSEEAREAFQLNVLRPPT